MRTPQEAAEWMLSEYKDSSYTPEARAGDHAFACDNATDEGRIYWLAVVKAMGLKRLEKRYAGFDWHYDRSDDHSVWSRGHAQWQAICREEQRLIGEGVTPEEIEEIRSRCGSPAVN